MNPKTAVPANHDFPTAGVEAHGSSGDELELELARQRRSWARWRPRPEFGEDVLNLVGGVGDLHESHATKVISATVGGAAQSLGLPG